jgi:hypothetical protein
MAVDPRPRNWIAALRRFVREPQATAQCELCSAAIAPDHAHLVEPASRRLLCTCEACAILLAHRQGGAYRRVPRQTWALSDFRMSDAQWDALLIPIGLAFFFRSSPLDRVIALYPGPAGATESQLGLTAWQELITANPVLGELEPDVEALLVNRIDGAREYYRVPIDRCYALVGMIRKHWRGLSGGEEAWTAVGNFLADLRGPAAPEVRNHA